MKEYGHRIPELSPFATRVRDVMEVLAGADLRWGRSISRDVPRRLHLVHGQRVRHEPRRLLGRIPGLRLVELGDSDLCCGSAGVYNLLEPGSARAARSQGRPHRRDRLRVVAAANPGCLLQIAWGCRSAA